MPYNTILMLVENGPLSSTGEQSLEYTNFKASKDVDRVASAALFNTQLQLPPGQAKLNGGGHKIEDSYEINHLLRVNPDGELEVAYQHSAFIADLLQGHREIRNNNPNPPQERPFVFIDVSGTVHRNMTLLHVEPERHDRRLQHTAVFMYKDPGDGSLGPKFEIITVDDIYAINYEMPPDTIPQY